MQITSIKTIYQSYEKLIGSQIFVNGRIRSLRDSKVFGFIELNDGSYLKNLQIVFESSLNNFEEICKFVLDKFNENLPLGLDIEKFEDFNGREFKVELGIIIPDEMLNFFKDREIREEKLFNLYNELFGNLSIKNI